MKEIIHKGHWVLVDAYYYKFWISLKEFNKYKFKY